MDDKKTIKMWAVPICKKTKTGITFSLFPKLYRTEGLAKTAIKLNHKMHWYGKVFPPQEVEIPCPCASCDDCPNRFTCYTEK